MAANGTLVLTTVEFDVLWERERFPRRHVALDVPSPGRTHTERAELVADTLASLEQRGLVSAGRAEPDLADDLTLLAYPGRSVYGFVWTADRKITLLAASTGAGALLGVVDGDEVWLIPTRADTLAEAAVSVAGDLPAGSGRSVSLPHEKLLLADARAAGDPRRLVTELVGQDVPLSQAHDLAAMCADMGTRGQFGVECASGGERPRRADRVVSFHDTPHGRYLQLVKPSTDGTNWSTIVPGDNRKLADGVWELFDELAGRRSD
ncbi:MAG: ESX secretion-associated protein EspG [Kutzneria sp.]|nr:ESX secretion-associated protein EspG [Kutzneria sp.]